MRNVVKRSNVLGMAAALALAVTVPLALAALSPPIEAQLPAVSLGLFVLLTGTALATFLTVILGVIALLAPDPLRRANAVTAFCAAFAIGLEAFHHSHPIGLTLHFALVLAANTMFAFAWMSSYTQRLTVTGELQIRPPQIAGGLLFTAGAAAFLAQSFVSLDRAAVLLPAARDLFLFITMAGLGGILTFSKTLRLDPKSAMTSLRARLPRARSPERAILFAVTASLGVALLVHALLSAFDKTALSVVAVSAAGLLRQAFFDLENLVKEAAEGRVTGRLATASTKRFVTRHMTDTAQWAASVGIKTASFVIDHDPESFLAGQLPTSIMQIRAEEIHRCVGEVLGNLLLQRNSIGHRVNGAIDPELSVRPCIDSLKLFSALYLDAGPLVERRIKGLTSLLPIVDPGLAKVLQAKDVGSLIRRNLWFFHSDFEWIDQHVVHSPKATRYDVRMGALSSRVRHAMMDHAGRTGGVGNFAWIGPAARERLIQEAPAMISIIEPCPIGSPTSGGDKLLMFVIKFEQLIPRLQRYYDLDSMRKSLLDFEPSQESARVHALLKSQIQRAGNATDLARVVESIATVPWRGFKEKDSALLLIIAVHAAANARLSHGETLLHAKDAKLRALAENLVDAVRLIGYPSQVLHHAQIDKIALRDAAKLIAAAGNVNNPRFEEAWLLLATTDYERHGPEERGKLHEFLRAISGRSALAKNRLVQVKAVDAFAALGKAAGAAEQATMQVSLEGLARWFSGFRIDPDVICHLLDAKYYLAAQRKLDLDFSRETTALLDQALRTAQENLGATHPKIIAVMSRWQEYRKDVNTTSLRRDPPAAGAA